MSVSFLVKKDITAVSSASDLCPTFGKKHIKRSTGKPSSLT